MTPRSAHTRGDRPTAIAPIDPESMNGPPRCTATVRRTGERCRKYPIRFAKVCLAHGGGAGQVRRKAAQREQYALALAELQDRGYEPMADPVAEQLRLASESVAFKDLMAQRVAELTHLSSVDRTGAETVSAVLSVYQASLKDAAQLLTQINRLDLAERKFIADNLQLVTLAEAIRRAVWSVPDLTFEQGEAILDAISREFARLTGDV